MYISFSPVLVKTETYITEIGTFYCRYSVNTYKPVRGSETYNHCVEYYCYTLFILSKSFKFLEKKLKSSFFSSSSVFIQDSDLLFFLLRTFVNSINYMIISRHVTFSNGKVFFTYKYT